MSEQKKKKWGDRSDAVWLKDLPSMNRIMPCIMPNRADNEAFISVDIDYKPLEAYLAKKNEGLTEDKYTFFHVIACAIGKAFVLRPMMNRFVCNNRLYQRNDITVAFTVKKKFDDRAEEALAQFKIKQARSVDQVKFIPLALHRNHCQIQRCQTAGFLGVKVAYGGAILYSAHALKRTGGIQQCFCKGGFSASGMTGQHDISDIFALVIQRLTPLSHLPWQVLIQFIQK